jgi:hypothetical protein
MSPSENKISRRRFLLLSGGTALAVLCIGCLKRIDTQTDAETGATAAPDNTAANTEASATAVPAQINQPRSNITSCPRRLVNDPYPGRCRHYIDQNGDGYCDFSTSAN